MEKEQERDHRPGWSGPGWSGANPRRPHKFLVARNCIGPRLRPHRPQGKKCWKRVWKARERQRERDGPPSCKWTAQVQRKSSTSSNPSPRPSPPCKPANSTFSKLQSSGPPRQQQQQHRPPATTSTAAARSNLKSGRSSPPSTLPDFALWSRCPRPQN